MARSLCSRSLPLQQISQYLLEDLSHVRLRDHLPLGSLGLIAKPAACSSTWSCKPDFPGPCLACQQSRNYSQDRETFEWADGVPIPAPPVSGLDTEHRWGAPRINFHCSTVSLSQVPTRVAQARTAQASVLCCNAAEHQPLMDICNAM